MGFPGRLYKHWLLKVHLSFLNLVISDAMHTILIHDTPSEPNITSVSGCVLLLEEQILTELTQITILP